VNASISSVSSLASVISTVIGICRDCFAAETGTPDPNVGSCSTSG
jgi:hypothetical protein